MCGIEVMEEFDIKNNDSSKFVYYEFEIVELFWYENFKVLFVINGIFKIYYYIKEYNGVVFGMEDVFIIFFIRDMLVFGDGIVVGIF